MSPPCALNVGAPAGRIITLKVEMSHHTLYDLLRRANNSCSRLQRSRC
jgi:hypothetical protein